MGYEIDYNKLYEDKYTRQQEAIKGITNWSEKLLNVGFDMCMAGYSYRAYSFNMGMAGVQGYPNAALWDYVKECCTDMTQ